MPMTVSFSCMFYGDGRKTSPAAGV